MTKRLLSHVAHSRDKGGSGQLEKYYRKENQDTPIQDFSSASATIWL